MGLKRCHPRPNHGGLMQDVTREIEIDEPQEKVWDLLASGGWWLGEEA